MTIRTLVLGGGALVVAMFAGGVWTLTQIPADAQIPVHWSLDGRPDGFAPAWLGLFGMPTVAAGALILLALIPRLEPRRTNLERSFTAYVSVGIAIVAVIGLLQVGVVAGAIGRPVDVTSLALVGVGLLFVLLGNFLGKTRSNWTMGIRTPWTLGSERSWTRTHRLGGFVFIGIGLAVILSTAVLGAQVALWIMLALVAIGVVGVGAYSWFVWRGDPDRQQGAIRR